jgi:V/A-type H+-transporting ATPase subunit E
MMDTKIQSLTEKLYNEGVEKGKNEAANIITNAKEERSKILKNAETEAEKIIANAKKGAEEIKKNAEAELKLYTSQSVEALKSEISNLITDKITNLSVTPAFEDKDFMQKMILKLVSEWSKNENLIISVSDAEELKKYFETYAKDLLNKGIKIEQVNGKSTSFAISPDDKSYKINFGEQEFINYFKSFLRPRLIELLF